MGLKSFAKGKASEIFKKEVKPMVKFDEDENGGDEDFDNDDNPDNSEEEW